MKGRVLAITAIINSNVVALIQTLVTAQPNISLSKVHKAYMNSGARGRKMDLARFGEVYGFLVPNKGDGAPMAAASSDDSEAELLAPGTEFVYVGKRKGVSTWTVVDYDGDVALACRSDDVTAAGKPKKGVSPGRWPNLASKIAKGVTRKGESDPIFSLA